MKKKLIVLLALALALSMMVPTMAETIKLAYQGGSLTLRSGAGTSYSAVDYLKNGDVITVLSMGNVWSKIKTAGGKEGYVKNLYISGIGSNYADGTSYYGTRANGTIKTNYADSTVNLRSGASTSTASIKKLSNGTKVKVLGENGSFYLVETTAGTQGFVSKSYVKKTSSSSTVTTAKVTASALNMRSGAGTSYGVMTTLAKGTKVTVLSTSNSSWWKVQYGSKTGYMSSKYLKKN